MRLGSLRWQAERMQDVRRKTKRCGSKTLTSLTANHKQEKKKETHKVQWGGRGGWGGVFPQLICSETALRHRALCTFTRARLRVGAAVLHCRGGSGTLRFENTPATLCLTPALPRACTGEIKEQPNWSLCTASLLHAVPFLGTK